MEVKVGKERKLNSMTYYDIARNSPIFTKEYKTSRPATGFLLDRL
jgi:hypothetical protein